jgi:hypothetical protein
MVIPEDNLQPRLQAIVGTIGAQKCMTKTPGAQELATRRR